ncbi:hypothetical protein BW722_06190 [Lawsonia intracellularis]|uniref:HEAT repeat domain-containing protein n=1 Tax=Lawsonia intracellularis TaxID=29546 RepID=UPI0009769957|nr:HEAT repeat domain-containing protein [Lawsonia intracellularis]OMQ02379.1 hypothetical protein BW722_06190 [Lawsonia intracellularis]
MINHNVEQITQEILTRLESDKSDEIRSAAFEAAELKVSDSIPLLIKHLQSPNFGVQEAAEYAIRKIRGVETVQSLIPLLRLEDVAIRNSAIDILQEIGADDLNTLYKLLHDQDVDIRIFVADILGSVGSFSAVSMLIEVLENDTDVNVRYQACISLGKLGYSEAKGALSNALEKDEDWVQFAAVEALTKLKANACVDILLAALPKSSDFVASTIINALGIIGNMLSVPVLLQQLDKSTGPLRNATVKAIIQIIGAPSLGLLGEKDLDKLYTYLLVALEDEDEEIVLVAFTGLSFFQGKEATTRKVFERIQKMDSLHDADLLSAAIKCLIDVGYNSALKEGIFSKNEEVVKVAIEVCGSIGDQDCVGLFIESFWILPLELQRFVINYLVNIADTSHLSFFTEVLSRHTDISIIKAALLFLGKQLSPALSSDILSYLYHPDVEVRKTALEACLALNDEQINKQVIELFFNEDPSLRMLAIYAMGKISPETYVNSLLLALKDSSGEVRRAAIESLGELSKITPELFESISSIVYDECKEVRLALINLVKKIGTQQSLSFIINMLEDSDSWVVIRAIEALIDYKTEEVAVLAIINRLENADVLVTMKIIEALGIIGGKLAFQALLNLINHENPDIQQAVSDALSYIQEEQGEDF